MSLMFLDSYITTYSSIRAQSSANEHHMENVKNWFTNNPNAIIKDHEDNGQEFIDFHGDVIHLVSPSTSPMAALVERIPIRMFSSLFPAKHRYSDISIDSSFSYTSGAGLEAFASSLITVTFLFMMFGPIWWLQFVINDRIRLAIITVSVIIFTVLWSVIRPGAPFEVLGATAAYVRRKIRTKPWFELTSHRYSTVLALFLQSGPAGSGS